MTMTIHLRDYQSAALAARVAAETERPMENRQAIVMATGLGKTITFGAEAAQEPGRSLILVHTDELASQAEAKVKLMAPGRTVGVVKAERDETGAEIIIGSVQTLANPDRRRTIKDVARLIVDECHHATSPSYVDTLKHFGGFPDFARYPSLTGIGDGFRGRHGIPVTGYTATLERGDGRSLGGVWHDVAFTRGISWAVRKGFLVPPVGYRVEIPALAYQASDSAMDNALVDSLAPERVVDAWLEHGQGRSTVLFAPLVRSARAFCDAFEARGISAEIIHGAMPKSLRESYLRMYEAGKIQVLCNAMVLTEGWDSPRTKCVIVARPTKSRPLFIQMAGRGLRRWLDGDKDAPANCVLLCVADSTTDLCSIADLSDRPDLKAEDGKSLVALEDEFDLSRDLEPDPEHAYAGAVDVTQFDPLVARSSKVWTKTKGGALFIPADKGAWVFLAPDTEGLSVAYVDRAGGRRVFRRVPDTELAMSMAEDFATDHGGDIGRLLADKDRAWRKGVPSEDAKAEALRLGLEKELARIMAGKASGKAGKLSDLISTVKASRVIDPVIEKIKVRTGR
jgi:superfamily II DNA or RNA helicase